MTSQAFTPAAGLFTPTRFYDRGVALLTREEVWRRELLKLVAPGHVENILDVGCGTGSFAVMLKAACPQMTVLGVDPDLEALAIAEAKAREAGVEITWNQGFARPRTWPGQCRRYQPDVSPSAACREARRFGLHVWCAAPRRTAARRGLCPAAGAPAPPVPPHHPAAGRDRRHPAQFGWRASLPDGRGRFCERPQSGAHSHCHRHDRADLSGPSRLRARKRWT